MALEYPATSSDQSLLEAILAEFDQQRTIYVALTGYACSLLKDIITSDVAPLHLITPRPTGSKDRMSLARKLGRPDKNYKALSDITDIAGVRVTAYFAQDVNRIAAKIEGEFVVDKKNSIDKRVPSDPDRFGYQSLHYVVSLPEARCALTECSRFRGLKFEIQIRSILQHAWAEIEHDLGYQSIFGVPYQVRRRFSRVASLLELADEEFDRIRGELKSYEHAIPADIASSPEKVGIDKISLRALVGLTSSTTHQLSADIARLFGLGLVPATDDELEKFAHQLSYAGVKTIADVERAAKAEREVAIRYVRETISAIAMRGVTEALGLALLSQILLARSPGKLYEYVIKTTKQGQHIDPHGFVQVQSSTIKRITEEIQAGH